MKRILVILCTVLFLGGCVEVTTVSYNEPDKIPRKVEKLIEPEDTLQMIQKKEGHYYIIFHSNYDVNVNYVTGEDTIEIHLHEQVIAYHDRQMYVYELTVDNGPEIIEVYLNGEILKFDTITVL